MPTAPIATFAGNVPANYDRFLGPVLFEPYALDLVERLQETRLENVLELACGTGRVTRHLAALLDEKGKFFATDLNPGMIELAKTKVQDERITWQLVDAQELPYESNTFDHVICQFGVMFFPDKVKAFKEANRVLEEGGLFLFNTWDSLDKNVHSLVVQQAMVDIMADEAPDFMTKGPFSYFDKDLIENQLKEAGFDTIEIDTVFFNAVFESKDNIIRGFMEGSPLAQYLEKLSEDVRERVRQRIIDVLNETLDNKQELPMQALVCSAMK